MNKTRLILINELRTVILRKSFLISLFLLPLIGFGIMFGAQMMQRSQNGFSLEKIFTPSEPPEVEGLVDLSGIVQAVPEEYQESLLAYPDEAQAEAALADGKIGAYYVIAPDYIENGGVEYVQQDYNPINGMMQNEKIEHTLNYNLLQGDKISLQIFDAPLQVSEERLSLKPEQAGETGLETVPGEDENPIAKYAVPYIVMMIFYSVLMTSATLLLNSISKEKENRVLEILMTSTQPHQILAGKIVALGAAGLLQTLVWTGSGLLLVKISGQGFGINLGAVPALTPTLLVWGVVFFLLGYAVYASLMAGIGALVPNLREASQLTMIVIMPLIIPLMLMGAILEKPHSILSIVLSLFPLTSPTTMMMRLAGGNVPLWQPLTAALILAASAFLAVRAAAGMFRAQNLLSGQSVNVGLFLKALVGKA